MGDFTFYGDYFTIEGDKESGYSVSSNYSSIFSIPEDANISLIRQLVVSMDAAAVRIYDAGYDEGNFDCEDCDGDYDYGWDNGYVEGYAEGYCDGQLECDE